MIKNEFLAIMMHLWGTKTTYVLVFSKMTSFSTSEGVSEFTFGSI